MYEYGRRWRLDIAVQKGTRSDSYMKGLTMYDSTPPYLDWSASVLIGRFYTIRNVSSAATQFTGCKHSLQFLT
jgi:hypothetical protein